jgi:DNA-binding response OmpR family regulator
MSMATPGLQGRKILVVEDDYLIAELIATFLKDAGAEVVGPMGWLDEAFAYTEGDGAPLDAVVLDVNLHGKKSYPLADLLAARKVRFLFVTGYGAEAVGDAYAHYPRCPKPFKRDVLIAALENMMP